MVQLRRTRSFHRQTLRAAFLKTFAPSWQKKNTVKADGIAVRQLQILREYQGPREKKLRLSDVKEMFLQMKDQV